jgi:para-aminobenzoate synthetase component I
MSVGRHPSASIRSHPDYDAAMFGPTTPLTWDFSPPQALRRGRADRPIMLLHSGRPDPLWARRSILAEAVGFYRYRLHHQERDTHSVPTPHDASRPTGRSSYHGESVLPPDLTWTHRPLRDLRQLLAALPGPWIGYLSYDLGRWIERLPAHAAADRAWPLIELAYCPGLAIHDSFTGRWSACGTWRDPARRPALEHAAEGDPVPPPAAGTLQSVFTPVDYEAAIQRCLDYIAAGDVFQVNLSQRFTAPWHARFPHGPRCLFEQLANASPAWYGAYLEFPAGGQQGCDAPAAAHRAIACTSPELFLDVDARGRVTSRPIKGTRPGHVDPEALRRSAKDIAELNMIVDLVRNDLGRVCAYGSVRVPQPRVIETHPTIHHGVATVTGSLHPSRDLIDLIRAAFPPGSVTGAPKVRAMQIIDELEPVRRGPYCGAIGWLHGQQACLNVAIRTMMLELPIADSGAAGRVDLHVGGGIVADSDPAAERQETLDKALAMRLALAPRQAAAPMSP